MEISDVMTEEDFKSEKYHFLSQNNWVPYITIFEIPDGRRELVKCLANAPENAVKWRFQTYFKEITINTVDGKDYATIEFYALTN